MIIAEKGRVAKVFRKENFKTDGVPCNGHIPSILRDQRSVNVMHSLEAKTPQSFRKANRIPTLRHERVSIFVFTPPELSKGGIHIAGDKILKSTRFGVRDTERKAQVHLFMGAFFKGEAVQDISFSEGRGVFAEINERLIRVRELTRPRREDI